MNRPDRDDFRDQYNLELLRDLYGKAIPNLSRLGGFAAISLLLSLVAISLWPRSYTATATIAPTTSLGTTGSSGVASALSAIGARSLLGSGEISPFDMYIDVLKSKRLAQQLTEKTQFPRIIFHDQWDPQMKSWKAKSGLLHRFKISVKSVLGLTSEDHPGVDDMVKFLASHLIIVSKESASEAFSPITEIAFKYNDPDTAKQMLQTILDDADAILRRDRR